CRFSGRVLHQLPQTIPPQRVPAKSRPHRRFEMSYSRRNFLKAAGSGVVLTAIGGDMLFAAPTPMPGAFSTEKGSFVINGKPFTTEYEARTTLWEVIAMKAGLTG